MNPRIKELYEQAQDWADNQNLFASEYYDYMMEKFAELIVKECAALIPAEQSHAPDGRPMAEIFEEHFG